jgi:hypothetical protein
MEYDKQDDDPDACERTAWEVVAPSFGTPLITTNLSDVI